jgi:hypothetical protein
VVVVPISLLNGSLTPSMVAVQDFGMEGVMAIIIVSQRKKNAKIHVLNHLGEVNKQTYGYEYYLF